MRELLSILMLQAGYTSTLVQIGVTALGLGSGAVGCFALLRGRALVSDAIAHATLPGIAGAFLVAVWLNGAGHGSAGGFDAKSLPILLAGAVVSGLVSIAALNWLTRTARLSEDASLAVVLSVFFGFGVVLLSIVQRSSAGGQAGLSRFILGQTAAMQIHDVWLMLGVAVLSIGACVAGFRHLGLLCFDRAFATTSAGARGVSLVDGGLLLLIVLVTVVGLQAVGLILVVAMLVIPPSAARFWSNRLRTMLVVSMVIGGLSGYIGAALSAVAIGWPAGGVIVLTASGLFVVSMVFAPARGLAWRATARITRARKARLHHALRRSYEQLESAPGASVLLEPRLARMLIKRGLATETGTPASGISVYRPTLTLTPTGLVEAARVTRVHRLWEQYLVVYGGHAVDHADDPADLIEHVLDAELIGDLERSVLGNSQRAASAALIPVAAIAALVPPPSVHPLKAGPT